MAYFCFVLNGQGSLIIHFLVKKKIEQLNNVINPDRWSCRMYCEKTGHLAGLTSKVGVGLIS